MTGSNTKVGRVVTLAAQGKANFEKGFKKSDGSAKKERIINLQVPLFNGETFENDGRGHNVANMTVNLDNMSNYGKANGSCKYIGSAGPENASVDQLAPVYVQEFTDATVADRKDAEKVRVSFDPKALAAANFKERTENSKANGLKAPSPESADRLSMRVGFSTTHKGVAGMTKEGFAANIAKAAQQKYVLTATRKNPEAGIPSREDIDKVAGIFADAYAKFAKEAVEKGCDGVKSIVDKNGKRTASGPIIEGTNFGPLKDLGISVSTVDGATVIGGAADGKDASTMNKALVAFNAAFNAKMSQEINGNATLTAEQKSLGNMMDINAYAVAPPDRGIMLVQPSAVANLQPYSSAVQKAYDAAMHDGPNGVAKTPEEIYGKDIINNAQKIRQMYDTSLSKDKDTAKGIQDAMYDSVAKEVAGIDAADKDITD